MEHVKSKLSALKRGDIFKCGDKCWDEMNRFHSIDILGGKFIIYLISINYLGNINKLGCAYASTQRDTDVDVYIPLFKRSTFKKSYGMPYIHIREENPQDIRIFPYAINDINIVPA